MGTIQRIALRNLNRQKKRTFLLGGAIAFGILIVTCISSVALVFQTNLAANMAQLNAGHLFVQGIEKLPSGKTMELIREDELLMDVLARSGIKYESVSRRTYAEGQLIFNGKRASQGIYGITLSRETQMKDRLKLKEGSLDRLSEPGGLILSEGIVKKLKLELDDRLEFTLRTISGQNNVGSFRLVGISYDMGLMSEMIAYTDQVYLNGLRGLEPEEYDWFGVLLPNLGSVEAASVVFKEALKAERPVFELSIQDLMPKTDGESSSMGVMGGNSRYMKLVKLAKNETWDGIKYRIFTINDMLSVVLEIAQTVSFVSITILVTLFAIIMVGIGNTFRMIMYERIKEIGTMRAVGMQRRDVRKLFLWEATFLALGGVIAGWVASFVALGILSIPNFGTTNVIALFLKNGHLNFLLNGGMMAIHLVLVVILTVVAASLPARKAAKMPPAVALRTAQ